MNGARLIAIVGALVGVAALILQFGLMFASMSAEGFGPIRRPEELPRALRAAIECVERGGVAVVDVRVEPGYAPVETAATLRGASG